MSFDAYYPMTELEQVCCFRCPLDECLMTSVMCPINRLKQVERYEAQAPDGQWLSQGQIERMLAQIKEQPA